MALLLAGRDLVLGASASAPSSPGNVEFSRDVLPILSDNCFKCHGPDEKGRKAGLRLDRREEALKGGKSGEQAVIPGKPEESALIKRVQAAEEDEIMPPPKSGRKLSSAQKELLARCIAQGARWQSHWAFTPPQRPPLPAVGNPAWARNDIDRFVLARLEREGLHPSPEADRITLLRRVTLDLIGLPPRPAEVDAYLIDQSANAYEKAVDRLLASPHYGERMALPWLDAARYADSNGFQQDGDTHQYVWRDWVVRALNQNLPFDQFTIEQLAGDLLPNASHAQKIASGFNRCHMLNGEGGAIAEALKQARETLAARKKELDDLKVRLPRVMIMSDAKPRQTRILERGNYTLPQAEVFPATPAFLPPPIPRRLKSSLSLATAGGTRR